LCLFAVCGVEKGEINKNKKRKEKREMKMEERRTAISKLREYNIMQITKPNKKRFNFF
jgi:hypothetical protein